MDARLEKIEKSEAYLEIEVDAATIEEGLEKAYRKVVKQVNVPGFRKGRVPRELLEAHFGKEVLYEDALEFVIPEAYEKAIQELKIEVLAQPEFDIGEIKSGEALQFKVKVAVKPEVKLGQLEGLEVSVPTYTVNEADVDKQLETMRSRYALLVDKTDGVAEIGDTVQIDFLGMINGIPFDGGQGEDYQLELGSNTFIPGFEDQLVGMKVGGSKDVVVSFPAEYHAEDLAGQEAVFQTMVNKIQHRELRTLDDEFAQEISEFETMEELRNDVRENLTKSNEYRQKGLVRKEVLARAAEQCSIDVAPAVAEMQFQTLLSQFEERIGSQGISLEQYFQLTNSNLHEFQQDMMPEAERNARTNFMLEKIIEEKGFEITDDEVDKQMEEIAQQMGVSFEQAQQNLAGVMDKVRYNLKVDKAIEYLVSNAVISEKELTPDTTVGENAE